MHKVCYKLHWFVFYQNRGTKTRLYLVDNRLCCLRTQYYTAVDAPPTGKSSIAHQQMRFTRVRSSPTSKTNYAHLQSPLRWACEFTGFNLFIYIDLITIICKNTPVRAINNPSECCSRCVYWRGNNSHCSSLSGDFYLIQFLTIHISTSGLWHPVHSPALFLITLFL